MCQIQARESQICLIIWVPFIGIHPSKNSYRKSDSIHYIFLICVKIIIKIKIASLNTISVHFLRHQW